jgi:hypothetical protein
MPWTTCYQYWFILRSPIWILTRSPVFWLRRSIVFSSRSKIFRPCNLLKNLPTNIVWEIKIISFILYVLRLGWRDFEVPFSPPLWSSGQSSWIQIQRYGFDSQRYHIFWELLDLLDLVSTIEELLERKSSDSGLENLEYSRRNPSHWPRGTLYPQNIGTNFAYKGGRWVGTVH